MTTPNDILMDRLRRLRQALDETGLHAVVLRDASHRRYITGFTGSTGWAVITGTRAWLVTDGRYWERAREEAPHFELVPVRTSYKDALQTLFRDLEGPVGFEAETVTVDEFERLYRPASHVDWRRADAILHRLRQVKDEEEMALLRQAAAITDAAARALPSLLRPGVSEREVAWELEKYMREHGAEALAFPIIVAFGENSALPHAEPGDRRLRPEMAVCVDMGARVAGYCADLTRSFWYGREPEEEYVKAWEATRWALTAALVGLRPGLRGRYVDALARDALGVRGYGEYFLHSVGHGVGLDIHERPRLGRNSDDILPAGTVITLEPGVYLPHRWGIRLEEFVILWDNGPEIVSQAPMWPVLTP